jgi:hypothetical protein
MIAFKNLEDFYSKKESQASNLKNIKILEEEEQQVSNIVHVTLNPSSIKPNSDHHKKLILEKLITSKRDPKLSSRGRSLNPYSLETDHD